jgi:hypothetical protein
MPLFDIAFALVLDNKTDANNPLESRQILADSRRNYIYFPEEISETVSPVWVEFGVPGLNHGIHQYLGNSSRKWDFTLLLYTQDSFPLKGLNVLGETVDSVLRAVGSIRDVSRGIRLFQYWAGHYTDAAGKTISAHARRPDILNFAVGRIISTKVFISQLQIRYKRFTTSLDPIHAEIQVGLTEYLRPLQDKGNPIPPPSEESIVGELKGGLVDLKSRIGF